MKIALFCLTGLLCLSASARSLGGKSFKEEVKVGAHELHLNGVGLREATVFNVDVYAAGLYVPVKSHKAADLANKDKPWRLVLKFVRDVDAASMKNAFKEGFSKNKMSFPKKLAQLNGMVRDVKKGQVIRITYLPGEGTYVVWAGKAGKAIPGGRFASALLKIWIGPHPPNAGLKKGLLDL